MATKKASNSTIKSVQNIENVDNNDNIINAGDINEIDKEKESNDQLKIGITIVGILVVAALIAIMIYSQKQTISGTDGGQTPIKNNGVLENIKKSSSSNIVETGSNIKVDYVGKLEDGIVFDSSIEEFAKKMKNYDPKVTRTYEPLSFTVGAGQMIKGFDEGVVGMKLGEKKTLKLSPKNAYGEAFSTQTIPAKYLKDVIEQEVAADNFNDVVSRSFPKETLGAKSATLKVGDNINEGGIDGKVSAITASGVTIAIKNTQNPFYGKKLAVGLVGEFQGNKIKIIKMTADKVTLSIDNKQNPFYGKKLAVGLAGKLPNGENAKISKIDGDNVDIEIKNQHELAGKTLIFDVEIKEIN